MVDIQMKGITVGSSIGVVFGILVAIGLIFFIQTINIQSDIKAVLSVLTTIAVFMAILFMIKA